MGKRKAKKAPTLLQTAIAPTPEVMRGDEWERGTLDGRKVDPGSAPHYRVPKTAQLHRLGWIDADQLAAVTAYERMMDVAGWGRTRSCLDTTPRGGEPGTHGMDARAKIAACRNACAEALGNDALMALDAVLFPDASFGPQNLTDIAVRLYPGREARARDRLKRMVEATASRLVEVLGLNRRVRIVAEAA